MAIKYNIYYSTTADGPWTLANVTPITHIPSSTHSFTITGLDTGTTYFVTIIGGEDGSGTFVPLVSQSIGPVIGPIGGVGLPSARILEVKPFGPPIEATESLSHQFGLLADDGILSHKFAFPQDDSLSHKFDIPAEESLSHTFDISSIV